MVSTELLIIVVSIFVLIKSSDIFIENIAKLAKIFKVSDFIIGLTIVAAGTSLPELTAAIFAATIKDTGLIIGNVIGSNVANIGLVLGIASIFTVLKIDKRIFEREGLVLILITILLFITALNGTFSGYEGLMFIVIFAAYLFYLYEYPTVTRIIRRDKRKYKFLHFGEVATARALLRVERTLSYDTYRELLDKKNGIRKRDTLKVLAISLFSLVFLLSSARLLVTNSSSIATQLGINSAIIGITIIAIGTSLPELAVAISAAKNNKGTLIIGTILGSNIYNILIILGISSLITPITISALSLFYTLPVLLLMTVLFLWFIKTNWALHRTEGVILLTIYFLFILGLGFWLFF
jgi:cation:H+ antiporter